MTRPWTPHHLTVFYNCFLFPEKPAALVLTQPGQAALDRILLISGERCNINSGFIFSLSISLIYFINYQGIAITCQEHTSGNISWWSNAISFLFFLLMPGAKPKPAPSKGSACIPCPHTIILRSQRKGWYHQSQFYSSFPSSVEIPLALPQLGKLCSSQTELKNDPDQA